MLRNSSRVQSSDLHAKRKLPSPATALLQSAHSVRDGHRVLVAARDELDHPTPLARC